MDKVNKAVALQSSCVTDCFAEIHERALLIRGLVDIATSEAGGARLNTLLRTIWVMADGMLNISDEGDKRVDDMLELAETDMLQPVVGAK